MNTPNQIEIVARKLNNVYMKLASDPAVLREVQDHFSFMAPNYQYSPKFKEKVWDGKIRLLNLNTRCMYLGLYDAPERFCEKSGYALRFEDENPYNRILEAPIDRVMVRRMVDNIKLPEKYSVRDYQFDAVCDSLVKKRNLVISATGSGKSLIMYLIVRALCATGQTILIIVPRIDLAIQLSKDFEEYSSDNKWSVEKNVHTIYGGQEKNFGKKRVVISTWQSLQYEPLEYLEQFSAMLCDEVHEYTADATKGILEKCVTADYRLGFTGTLRDSKIHEMVLEGLFSQPVVYSTSAERIKSGDLSELQIKALVLQYSKKLVPKALSYKEEIDFIAESPERRKFLLNLAMACKGNTVVMFTLVDKHANKFYEDLCAVAHRYNKVPILMTGDVKTEQRTIDRMKLETMDNAIVVASFGTFSTGINVPNLHNIVFASPTKSKTRVLQSIGRVLRKHKSKTVAKLFDIVDDMTCGKRGNNKTLEHFMERYQRYIDEEYDVKIQQFKLG